MIVNYQGVKYQARPDVRLNDAVERRLVVLPDGVIGTLIHLPLYGKPREGRTRNRGAKATVLISGRRRREHPENLTVLDPI